MGLTGGVWMARVPSAKSQAHLSDGTLGVALFAVPVGLVLGAALAERLVDRVGSTLLCRICGVGSCAALVTPGLAHSLPGLMAGLFVIGVVGGTLDVAQNAQGVRVEAAYARPVMTSMHAFYSLGAILGSLAGGGLAWAGVALLPSLAVVGAVGALVDGTAGPWLLPKTSGSVPAPAAASEPVGPPGQLYWPDGSLGHDALSPGAPRDNAAESSPATGVTDNSADARRRVRRLVLALGVLGVCGLVGEGAAGDWSAVYLRDNLGTSAGFAALGFAAFSITMTLGRAVGDRLVHRFGVVSVIRVCGLIATAGLALTLATSAPAAAIAGFTAFGAGLSIVVPQVFAAGGRADPFRPGSGLAKVVGLGYAGMSAGPAIIGVVASKIGLHLALLIPVALSAWIAVAATALRTPENASHIRGNARTRSHAPQRPAYLKHMDDKEIMSRITELIDTEHELRGQLQRGELSSEQERERLRSAEQALDQCWDLLRQRRAKREFGESPEGAAVRPVSEVEGYQQ
jgi:MFS family permease